MNLKLKAMIQRSEIGKYRSVQSTIDVKLNRIYVTPNNEHYSLIRVDKIGNKRIYVYEWIDCPDRIKSLTNPTIQSKHELRLDEIIDWIKQLKNM